MYTLVYTLVYTTRVYYTLLYHPGYTIPPATRHDRAGYMDTGCRVWDENSLGSRRRIIWSMRRIEPVFLPKVWKREDHSAQSSPALPRRKV